MDQARFNIRLTILLEEIRDLLQKKGHDYTNQDALQNLKVLEDAGLPATTGALFEIGVKFNRLKNLLLSDKKPNFESIEDSIRDLISYGVLLELAYSEQRESRK